jgi:hypothetical protein
MKEKTKSFDVLDLGILNPSLVARVEMLILSLLYCSGSS